MLAAGWQAFPCVCVCVCVCARVRDRPADCGRREEVGQGGVWALLHPTATGVPGGLGAEWWRSTPQCTLAVNDTALAARTRKPHCCCWRSFSLVGWFRAPQKAELFVSWSAQGRLPRIEIQPSIRGGDFFGGHPSGGHACVSVCLSPGGSGVQSLAQVVMAWRCCVFPGLMNALLNEAYCGQVLLTRASMKIGRVGAVGLHLRPSDWLSGTMRCSTHMPSWDAVAGAFRRVGFQGSPAADARGRAFVRSAAPNAKPLDRKRRRCKPRCSLRC
jgi:hypothetical protein